MTAELFADAGIGIVLSGHEHCSDAAICRSAALNEIRDFATTSLTMYPLSYRLFTFTGGDVSYSSRTLQTIDTEALSRAVNGYTYAQLSLMDADLNAYSKAFLKAGVVYRLRLGLSAEKSGLTPGTPLYELLDAVYLRLDEVLSMPMDEAVALAAVYGIEVPVTPYDSGWDLAAEFVAAHYAGSERFALDSPEVTALLRLASLILKDVPASALESLFSEAVSSIETDALASAKALAKRVFGRINPGEVLVALLVSDLVYGFANDSDGVDDNNGVFSLAAPKTETLTLKLRAFFDRLRRLFENAAAIFRSLWT